MFRRVKRLIKLAKIKTKNRTIAFGPGANIDKKAEFGGQNRVGAKSWFEGYLGYGSYLGDECILKAKVGKYCSIGHKVSVLTGTHPSHVFVSTSPVFYSLKKQNGISYVKNQKFKEKIYVDGEEKYGAVIGNDVWIGYGATIMGGCTIGDGAIVATGALVKDDVPPYAIVAGQPAKIIGKRFTDAQIKWLLDFKWWDKPQKWIVSNANLFDNIEEFIEHCKREDC